MPTSYQKLKKDLHESNREIARLEARIKIFKNLLLEWRWTELDAHDEEFAPWLKSFLPRVDAALDKAARQAREGEKR